MKRNTKLEKKEQAEGTHHTVMCIVISEYKCKANGHKVEKAKSIK